MVNTIKAIDYLNRATICDNVRLDEVEKIVVNVVSGDEILLVMMKDTDDYAVFDASDERVLDKFYGMYIVWPSGFTEWSRRTTSYDVFKNGNSAGIEILFGGNLNDVE